MVHYGERDELESGVENDGRERAREGILPCVISFCGHTHALSITRSMFLSPTKATQSCISSSVSIHIKESMTPVHMIHNELLRGCRGDDIHK